MLFKDYNPEKLQNYFCSSVFSYAVLRLFTILTKSVVLELEVYEWLHLGRNELEHKEHNYHDYRSNRG